MTSVTSCTVWNDAVGKRISATYSVIDDATGKILKDNKRVDRVIADADAQAAVDTLIKYASNFVGVE